MGNDNFIRGYYVKVYDPHGYVLTRINVTLVKDTHFHLTTGNAKFVRKVIAPIYYDLEDKT